MENVVPLTQSVSKKILTPNSARRKVEVSIIGYTSEVVSVRPRKNFPGTTAVEVHTVSFDIGGGLPASGVWQLEFDGQLTNEFAHNEAAVDIQTNIQTLDGFGSVTVTGSYFGGFEFTMTGANMNTKVRLVKNTLKTSNIPMTQVLSTSDNTAPTLGTFTLETRCQVSPEGSTPYFVSSFFGPIAYDVTAAELQTILRRAYGDNGLTVGGTDDFTTGFTISHTVESVNRELKIAQNKTDKVLETEVTQARFLPNDVAVSSAVTTVGDNANAAYSLEDGQLELEGLDASGEIFALTADLDVELLVNERF